MRYSRNPAAVSGRSRSITLMPQLPHTLGASRWHTGTPQPGLSTRPAGFAVRSYAIGKPKGTVCGLLVRNPPGGGAPDSLPDSLPTRYLIAVGDPPFSVRPVAQVFCP